MKSCVLKLSKLKKYLGNLLMILSISLVIWFIISYIQVLCHQFDYVDYNTHFAYPSWNFFVWIDSHFGWLRN